MPTLPKKWNIIKHKNLFLHINMGKAILKKERLAILKLKKINFTTIKVLFLKKDVDIEKVLISRKISSGEENYKYPIGYLYNDHKVKSLHLMLPKTSAYVKSYDG